MDTKSLRVEVKDADLGEVEAVFSTFDVVDSDGDVTLAEAFTDGAPVRISAYGHQSWNGVLPVGKGVIKVGDGRAVMRGRFFMDTAAGRDTFTTVKELGDLQEWSYGFDIDEAVAGERDGKQVRILKRLTVHEVSPVLLGAGVGTRTLAVKQLVDLGVNPAAVVAQVAGQPPARAKRAIAPHETPVVSRSWDGPGVVAAIPSDARPSQLRSVFAWVNPDGDPEAKGSYKFAHHQGVDGPANIRACLAGIAVLNGARGGAGVPDADRTGIYNHLASHLRDADKEPPELRSGPGGTLKFNDELLETMAVVSGQIDSAARVVALRAEKGKTLSMVNAEVLDWITDDLRRLKTLLTTPIEGAVDEDELNSVFLASIARLQDL